MRTLLSSRNEGYGQLLGIALGRVVVLLLPACLLLGASARTTGHTAFMLLMGAAFQILVCLLSFLNRRSWQQPIGPSVITLYLIGFCWLWWGQAGQDWYAGLA